MEAKLQSKIIKWLKERGAYVIKTRPQPGTPTGCPDIIFLYGIHWGAIEVKADEKSPWQPGQQATLQHLKSMNIYVHRVDVSNWEIVRDELDALLFRSGYGQ